MATDNEILYCVTKKSIVFNRIEGMPLLFRTRSAARKYAADRTRKTKKFRYMVTKAKWGPEQ